MDNESFVILLLHKYHQINLEIQLWSDLYLQLFDISHYLGTRYLSQNVVTMIQANLSAFLRPQILPSIFASKNKIKERPQKYAHRIAIRYILSTRAELWANPGLILHRSVKWEVRLPTRPSNLVDEIFDRTAFVWEFIGFAYFVGMELCIQANEADEFWPRTCSTAVDSEKLVVW